MASIAGGGGSPSGVGSFTGIDEAAAESKAEEKEQAVALRYIRRADGRSTSILELAKRSLEVIPSKLIHGAGDADVINLAGNPIDSFEGMIVQEKRVYNMTRTNLRDFSTLGPGFAALETCVLMNDPESGLVPGLLFSIIPGGIMTIVCTDTPLGKRMTDLANTPFTGTKTYSSETYATWLDMLTQACAENSGLYTKEIDGLGRVISLVTGKPFLQDCLDEYEAKCGERIDEATVRVPDDGLPLKEFDLLWQIMKVTLCEMHFERILEKIEEDFGSKKGDSFPLEDEIKEDH